MPNFDAGQYFLTALAPIRAGTAPTPDGEAPRSHLEKLRSALATLPTALQSPATERIGLTSPFARNRRNHLCRLFVIDDAIYNGRASPDGITAVIQGTDPIHPLPVDRLNCAYLAFVAEIDAVEADDASLPETLSPAQQDAVRDSYARRLWETAETELRRIYECCEGFDVVRTADDFARYIARCQIETTLPFHDYWTKPPDLPTLPARTALAIGGTPLLLLVASALGWLFGAERFLWLPISPGVVFVVSLLASAGAIYGLYRWAIGLGEKPFPPARDGDLPSVLKALYLQQHFTQFASEHQGVDPESLHEAFGRFLEKHRPCDVNKPTQAAGVIRSILSPTHAPRGAEAK